METCVNHTLQSFSWFKCCINDPLNVHAFLQSCITTDWFNKIFELRITRTNSCPVLTLAIGQQVIVSLAMLSRAHSSATQRPSVQWYWGCQKPQRLLLFLLDKENVNVLPCCRSKFLNFCVLQLHQPFHKWPHIAISNCSTRLRYKTYKWWLALHSTSVCSRPGELVTEEQNPW